MYKNNIIRIILIFSFSIIYMQSNQDLQKMKVEYEKYKTQQSQLQPQQPEIQRIDPETGLPQRAEVFPYSPLDNLTLEDTADVGLQYFGYDFFSRRDTIAFWENLPAPENYLLGPGDELVISIWGETQQRGDFIISREGNIYDQKVGLLFLMGKTIKESEKYLKNQYGRIYATLNGNKPTSFLDVSLGQLRSINVNFVGEVNYPGVFPVHPFSTVITGLIQAGGVKETGSLRNIQIKRDGQPPINIDLYDYLLKGNYPKNIQLRDQDIVFVPVRNYSVTVDSFVVRPGIYEGIKSESIKDMIDYSGGLTSDAASLIELERILPIQNRNSTIQTTKNQYFEYNNSHLFPIQNGDTITVKRIFKSLNQVEIIGQVKRPGLYNFTSGMTLDDLIKLAGGFQDTTFLKSVYKKRGELVRRDPKTRYEKVIEINLTEVINEGIGNKIKLQSLDRFVVHANVNFFEKKNVKILGEVNIPGSYPVLKDNETLQSFIDRAGGFTTKAFKEGVKIFRDTLRVAWENSNIVLAPGDSVVIKERPGVVFVTGEVYNDGLIEYQPGKSVKYYIDSAGGVTLNGNKNDILVIYANGVVQPKKLLSSPKVRDGATIIVNTKELSPPFNPTEFANTTLSLISSFITILVLSKQLQN